MKSLYRIVFKRQNCSFSPTAVGHFCGHLTHFDVLNLSDDFLQRTSSSFSIYVSFLHLFWGLGGCQGLTRLLLGEGGVYPGQVASLPQDSSFSLLVFSSCLRPMGGGCRFLGFPVPQRSGGTLRHGCEWMEGRERSHRSSILDLYSTG